MVQCRPCDECLTEAWRQCRYPQCSHSEKSAMQPIRCMLFRGLVAVLSQAMESFRTGGNVASPMYVVQGLGRSSPAMESFGRQCLRQQCNHSEQAATPPMRCMLATLQPRTFIQAATPQLSQAKAGLPPHTLGYIVSHSARSCSPRCLAVTCTTTSASSIGRPTQTSQCGRCRA